MKPILIQKEDGSSEEFVPIKLSESLLKAGAQPTAAEKIVRTVIEDLEKQIEDNEQAAKEFKVSDIYHKAFTMLKHMSAAAAARYSLRRSIMQFGPTGFPFEEYVAEIFKAKGYSSMTGQMVLGKCVPHEVDVVAWNKEKLIMAEVKYHNDPVSKTDLKVALYVKARYDDIKETLHAYGSFPPRKLDEGWLVTNTKFTDTAQKYAECNDVKLLSWLHPAKGNLLDLIEETKLHPVTCLTSLTVAEKHDLVEREIVLCKSIYENRQLLKEMGFSVEKIFKVMEEIGQIMNLTPQA